MMQTQEAKDGGGKQKKATVVNSGNLASCGTAVTTRTSSHCCKQHRTKSSVDILVANNTFITIQILKNVCEILLSQ
jgi:hypothetical protein